MNTKQEKIKITKTLIRGLHALREYGNCETNHEITDRVLRDYPTLDQQNILESLEDAHEFIRQLVVQNSKDKNPLLQCNHGNGVTMNIKANLKQLKKQFREHREVLAGFGIENPDGLLKDSMMNTRDGDMAYAFFVRGQIEVMERMAKELEVVR